MFVGEWSTWLYFFAVLWVAAELEFRRRFIAGSCMHCYRWPGMHVPKTTCISHRTTFWALMVINSVLLEFLITSSWRWTSCLFLLHWTIRGSNSHSAASRPRARLLLLSCSPTLFLRRVAQRSGFRSSRDGGGCWFAELQLRRRFIAGSCMHYYRWPGIRAEDDLYFSKNYLPGLSRLSNYY